MKFLLPIFFVAGGIFMSGCRTDIFQSSAKNNGAAVSSSRAGMTLSDPTDIDNRAEALARFAAGISYDVNEQPDKALEQFQKAALADPSNEPLVLDLSRRLLQKKKTDEAIEILSRAAKRPAACGKIFSWLGRSYLIAGKTNQAIEASRQAIKKSPNVISGYGTLVQIFRETGKTNEALKLLRNAPRSTNENVLYLIDLSELYASLLPGSGKEAEIAHREGLEVLNRAASLDIVNPNIRQRLADSYANLGETKRSAEIYVQLLDEFHDVELMRDAIRERLANLYLRSRDKAKAVEQLEAVVRDSPTKYPEAWFYLGAFAYESKDLAKAADYFNRALIVNPDFEEAYYELAGVQMNSDQPGEALKTLEKAGKKFPNSFSVEFLTALAYGHLKNFDEAVKHFTAAEIIGNTSDPRRLNHFFYFQFGAACERNHDFSQAEKYLRKCIELAPDFADALNYLGFMWADRGENLQEARAMIQKAVNQEPKNAAYIDSLGWVLFKLNDNEQALSYLLKAVELSDEPDAAILDHVGDVYHAMHQNEKAREAWQKSLSLEPNEIVRKKLQANSSTL